MSEEAPPENGESRLRSLRRSTRGRISLIWAIPLLAVVLGASLVVQTYLEKGPTIEIEFPEAAGIKAGATPIKFLDVEIGIVQELRLKDTQDGVIAVAELDAIAEIYLKEATVFWLVQPRFSLAGISGIETLLSGQYIEMVPAKEGAHTTSFQGALNPPIGARHPNAKSVVLEADRIGSITQGTSVSHRGLTAGEVERVELGDEGGPIRMFVVIDEAFASRVRETSRFWNSSGIQTNIGLDGVDVRTDGLAALLSAGIAFDSPDPTTPEAASGATFPLHAGPEAARESQLRRDSVAVQLESRDGTGLPSGTPIYYRGLEVGWLGSSRLTADAQAVRIQAYVEARFRPLIRKGTRFYKSSGVDFSLGLDGVRVRTEALRAVVLGGVSIAVPEGDGAPALDGAVFALYDEPEAAWLAWKPSVVLEGHADESAVEHRLAPAPNAGALELRLSAAELGGLSVGSPVLFRSVPVGEVMGTTLQGDGELVEIRVRIDREHRRLIGSETRFWRSGGLSLDVGLGGLEVEVGSLRSLALGGIAFGNPVGPGESARWDDRFTLHRDEGAANADLRFEEILQVVVEARESTLREGAPVYFRRHRVGEVGAASLTADARAVRIDLYIDRAFASLVRTNTRFWSPDAISVQASLTGVEVEAAPMQALLAGGVMLATPNEAATEAAEGTVFRLEETAPADWQQWSPDLPLGRGAPATFAAEDDELEDMRVLLVATDVEAIGAGDPIFFRGIQIGIAGAPRLAEDGTVVLVDALIDPEYAVIIRSNTHFWNASGIDLDIGWGGVDADAGPLETLIRGGIQVATPEPAGERARSDDRFELRADPEEGWRDWAPVLH